MTASFHDSLCGLLARRIGVRLMRQLQLDTLERFIAARMKARSLADREDYLRLLSTETLQGEEFGRLISVITNTHTFFYRDGDQLLALSQVLVQRWRRSRQPVRVWSAGCSTGEEPYTLAMICAEAGIEARILGTDVNRDALDVARAGRYQQWSLRNLPPAYVNRFFSRDADGYRIVNPVRRRVEFCFHNLLDPLPRLRDPSRSRFDLICCRNVLIYFDTLATIDAIRSFVSALVPDGWLFLGIAENLRGMETPLRSVSVGQSIGYQRAEVAPPKGAEREQTGPLWIPALTGRPFPMATSVGAPRSTLAGASPAVTAEEAYRQAVECLDRSDELGAETLLAQALERDPDHVPARITLGNLQLRRHRFEEALSGYKESQDRAPLLPEVHFLQGVVFRKLGDLEPALHAFRRALFLDPDFWCASFFLAGVQGRLGMDEQRTRSLQNTLAALQRRRSPTATLFCSYIQGMKDVNLDPQEVEDICRSGLEPRPGGSGPLRRTGSCPG